MRGGRGREDISYEAWETGERRERGRLQPWTAKTWLRGFKSSRGREKEKKRVTGGEEIIRKK